MAVGELERMAEQLTARGLGISPLASRAIQQAQLEGPQAALATSEATRRSAQQTRLGDLSMKLSQNYKYNSGGSRARGGSGGVFDPSKPLVSINPFSPTTAGETVGGIGGTGFTVQTPGQLGSPSTAKSFKTLEEVMSYISNTPALKDLPKVMGGTPEHLTRGEQLRLKNIGTQFLSHAMVDNYFKADRDVRKIQYPLGA